MNQRLVNLLASFIRGTSDYTLARLEFGMRFTAHPAPPVLDRLPDASERSLRERWNGIETQLEAVLTYLRTLEASSTRQERNDPAFRRLRRSARELDQYARALRWVLTVSGDSAL